MLAEGSWSISSLIDPRWSKSGKGMVGMFCSYDSIPEAVSWIEKCKNELGEMPDDLSWSYMKY